MKTEKEGKKFESEIRGQKDKKKGKRKEVYHKKRK